MYVRSETYKAFSSFFQAVEEDQTNHFRFWLVVLVSRIIKKTTVLLKVTQIINWKYKKSVAVLFKRYTEVIIFLNSYEVVSTLWLKLAKTLTDKWMWMHHWALAEVCAIRVPFYFLLCCLNTTSKSWTTLKQNGKMFLKFQGNSAFNNCP